MLSSASRGRSIRLFLVDGSSDGVVIAVLGESTTVVLFAPRVALADLLARAESKRTGVYVLVGPDPENPTRLLVYVGEGDDVAARLIAHDKDDAKDFFERVCLIVSRDDEFHKAHSRYLESRLLTAIKDAGRATLVNGTAPPAKGLNEADVADMERVLGEIALILPTFGFDVLTPSPGRKSETKEQGPMWVYNGGGCRARARESGDGFIVLAGPLARSYEVESASASVRAVRRQLLEDRSVSADSDGKSWRFDRDVRFKSSTAAAAAIYGGNISGPQYWLHAKTNQPYGEWRESQLSAAAEIDGVPG